MGLEQIDEMLRDVDPKASAVISRSSVKLMADGVVETHTAAMLEPYLDGAGASTGKRGIDFIDPGHLEEIVIALDQRGLSCHFHAIGDAAVRNSLNAVEAARRANGWSGARHVICHIQVVHPDDRPRFRNAGCRCHRPTAVGGRRPGSDRTDQALPRRGTLAPGSTHSAACCGQGPRWPWARTGRSRRPMSWTRSTSRSIGSAPIRADLEPLNAAERISLADAMAAFTAGSAYVNHREDVSGTIAPGMLADLVVLDRDPFSDGPIHDTSVDMTIVGGQVVYEEG